MNRIGYPEKLPTRKNDGLTDLKNAFRGQSGDTWIPREVMDVERQQMGPRVSLHGRDKPGIVRVLAHYLEVSDESVPVLKNGSFITK